MTTDKVRPSVRKGASGANLVYKRVSTDQQSTARQNLVLSGARIEDPVVFGEDAPALELPVTLDVPGKIADYLRTTELDESFGRPACSALHDVRADATKGGPVLVGKGLNCRALAEPSRRDGPSNALTTRPRSSFERMSQQVHNPGGVVLAHRYLSPARSRSGLGVSAGASTGWGRRHG
ncbi:hypothetical protein ACH4A8_05385 [Streptomyces vietnamensis]|uniref:hypothetical protein n=1 Tax=Streptomyces vietnamensis TaxID=362257 RepID=UPI0037A2C550